MSISQLQHQFLTFARSMPAIAIGNELIERDLINILSKLGGAYPSTPAKSMADIPMPVYDLSYSVFLDSLGVSLKNGFAELNTSLTATVHRRGRPDEIIREYKISSTSPIKIVLDYESVSKNIFWRQDGLALTKIDPAWGRNADDVLARTKIPDPKRDSYISEIETNIVWSTKNTFVSLVINVLPRYSLDEIAPWLALLEPIRFDFGQDHTVITASRARVDLGGCSPTTIVVEPDPLFPYGQPIPAPSSRAHFVDIAVYFPKTRLVDFVSGPIQPAILVSSENRSGLIKWSISGSFGIKKFMADINTVISLPNGPVVFGAIGISTAIDFVGAARAWVDGPSGTRLGLAGGSVIGSGEFSAEIRLEADIAGGFIRGDLKVTKSELPYVDFDVNTPFGWPLDAIAGDILDHVAKGEIRKLTNQIVHLGQWEFLGIPLSYLDTFGTSRVFPVMEGLKEVAAYMGIMRNAGIASP